MGDYCGAAGVWVGQIQAHDALRRLKLTSGGDQLHPLSTEPGWQGGGTAELSTGAGEQDASKEPRRPPAFNRGASALGGQQRHLHIGLPSGQAI